MPSGTYELQQQVGSFMAYYIHLIERSCNMLVLGCWDRNPATDHGTNRLCRDQRIRPLTVHWMSGGGLAHTCKTLSDHNPADATM